MLTRSRARRETQFSQEAYIDSSNDSRDQRNLLYDAHADDSERRQSQHQPEGGHSNLEQPSNQDPANHQSQSHIHADSHVDSIRQPVNVVEDRTAEVSGHHLNDGKYSCMYFRRCCQPESWAPTCLTGSALRRMAGEDLIDLNLTECLENMMRSKLAGNYHLYHS